MSSPMGSGTNNVALTLLKDKGYINGLADVANDEDERHRYLEFHSVNENRLVRLLLVNQTTLRDAETREETTFENENADEDDEEDTCSNVIFEQEDLEELARKHGCDVESFREADLLVNQPPLPGRLKEGLITLDEYFERLEAREVQELFVSDTLVDPNLKERLLKNIDRLRDSKEPDWHPGSNDVVNDIIHPTLFPFVMETEPIPEGDPGEDDVIRDRWGRKFRTSVYQWLPTDFVLDDDKKAKVKEGGFINNLPESGHDDLVVDIEELVSLCVPAFERTLQYANTMHFVIDQEHDREEFEDVPLPNLAGKTIQVVPKIAEYVFRKRGDAYEGVWHFEGLSHEHIVATAVYFPQLDERLEGGRLNFRRALTDVERASLYMSVRQYPLQIIYDVTKEMIPLGRLQTRENLLLMFANSHAHKLSKITNPTDEVLRRKIVALFFIDPEKRIQSTTGLKRPQETMTMEEAKEIRLEMMAERKEAKEDLNSHEIEFCEH